MEKITNLIKIQSNPKLKMSPDGDFFRSWVDFLRPVHKLTPKNMDVLAAFLKKRYILSKSILDSDVLDRVLMSKEIKHEIRESLGMKSKHFQVAMSKLRRKHVIENDKIYPPLVPSITDEGVGLMVYFDFKNEQRLKISDI